MDVGWTSILFFVVSDGCVGTLPSDNGKYNWFQQTSIYLHSHVWLLVLMWLMAGWLFQCDSHCMGFVQDTERPGKRLRLHIDTIHLSEVTWFELTLFLCTHLGLRVCLSWFSCSLFVWDVILSSTTISFSYSFSAPYMDTSNFFISLNSLIKITNRTEKIGGRKKKRLNKQKAGKKEQRKREKKKRERKAKK